MKTNLSGSIGQRIFDKFEQKNELHEVNNGQVSPSSVENKPTQGENLEPSDRASDFQNFCGTPPPTTTEDFPSTQSVTTTVDSLMRNGYEKIGAWQQKGKDIRQKLSELDVMPRIDSEPALDGFKRMPTRMHAHGESHVFVKEEGSSVQVYMKEVNDMTADGKPITEWFGPMELGEASDTKTASASSSSGVDIESWQQRGKDIRNVLANFSALPKRRTEPNLEGLQQMPIRVTPDGSSLLFTKEHGDYTEVYVKEITDAVDGNPKKTEWFGPVNLTHSLIEKVSKQSDPTKPSESVIQNGKAATFLQEFVEKVQSNPTELGDPFDAVESVSTYAGRIVVRLDESYQAFGLDAYKELVTYQLEKNGFEGANVLFSTKDNYRPNLTAPLMGKSFKKNIMANLEAHIGDRKVEDYKLDRLPETEMYYNRKEYTMTPNRKEGFVDTLIIGHPEGHQRGGDSDFYIARTTLPENKSQEPVTTFHGPFMREVEG